MPDVLLYGDTQRNPALRHEIPIAVLDPFLYAETDGQTKVMVSTIERERFAEARPDAELIVIDDLGFHELLRSGLPRDEVFIELIARAAERMGVREAVVDFEFPLGVAERLRADGIKLTLDNGIFIARRRAKSAAELRGIRHAQQAAETAIGAAAELLRSARADNGTLLVEGEPLLAETVRERMREVCWELGTLLTPETIVASVWQGFGHEPGSGPLPAGLPIQIDVWPQDQGSSCWADMTRTFVVGEPRSPEIARQEQLVREALEQVRASAKPGVTGRRLHEMCCDIFEAAGYRTQRTGPGEDRAEGFQFSLGHGVGLQVHEDPPLGQAGHSPLVPGDVIAIEPGLWDRNVGGVRFEDLLLVTEDGCETLTSYSYDLKP